MGDDEENFSSNINKPSLEQAGEKLIFEEKKLNGEEEFNKKAEKCEFRHKSEGEDAALMDKLETEAAAAAAAEAEGAVEGGIEGKEGMNGEVPLTVDVETKMEAEAVVGGGEKSGLVAEEGPVMESNMEVLDERVGGEKSDFDSADMQVMDSEGRMEVLAEETPVTEAELEETVGSGGGETVVSCVGDHELLSSAGPVVAAEESEAVNLRVEVATLGDGKKNAAVTGAGSGAAIEEAEAVVETVDLRADDAMATDGEKNASDIGVGSVATIEEGESVVDTVDIQQDEATIGNGEKNAPDIVAKSVAATEETKAVSETVDSQAERTVGDRDEDAGNTGISSQLPSADTVFAGKSDVVVVDEAAALVEGEKSIKSDNIQSIANESVVVEEVSKMVVPVESSSLMLTGVEKSEESAEGKESGIESAEIKLEREISTEVAEVTEGEKVTGLQVLQFVSTKAPNLVKQEKDKVRGITNEESLVADAKTDDIKEMEDKVRGKTEDESIVADVEMEDKVRGKTEEESIVADVEMEASKSVVQSFQEEGIPAAVTEMDKGKEIKEMDDKVRGKTEEESIVADAEMEASKSSVPSFQEKGIPADVTEMEKGKDVDMETTKVDDVDSTPKIDDSSVPQEEEKDAEMVAEEELALADTELETETDAGESSKGVGEKRKRGKNSKNLTNSKIVTRAQKIIDEDVCFICFDGGDLVLCDRRGCPKAYHPSCVNRDESFFRSKGRWNCGWHICSICQKNAYYMCYTCPFALCKGCIKDAVILCVRGNKGFCETCMRIVMLIESSDEGTNDVQIDFDDKSSWEYLFKDYFIDLKSKLSLSSAEIAKAKNPWKGSDVSAGKEESLEAAVETNNIGGSGIENSAENPEASKPKRKKVKKRLRSHATDEDSAGAAVRAGSEGVSAPGNMEWASKELLEFVMHMKNGDKSVLSQFDVQALLLEYIKRNKLRDPLRKSQIICDSRLENIFGKPRVGHFEMLKLLESHFFVKDDANADDVQGSVVDTEVNQLEADENAETPTKGNKEIKRKARKKGDKRGHLSNRYEYAAINTHNISLIYLRRKLMEDLLEDIDEFQHKVIGTFVRIRISGNTQKQDLYRLVQVVGTSKVDEPYKVGKRTTDMMLEILNLNKTEIVSIDTISNQDFTEEECKRLRQSIKCGLLNRMTVGDILDKAMEVQAARVNDWLESEILRLSHLRDRASDMGRRKELRECVEKLQILKTPEERLRRLEEIPKVHADPNMDPNHESEEEDSDADDNRREVFQRTSSSGFTRRGTKDSWNGGNILSKNWESNKNLLSKNLSISGEDANAIQTGELVNEKSWNQGREKDTEESTNLLNLNPYTKSESVGLNSNSVARSEPLSGVVSVNSSVSLPSKEAETIVKISETQKTWHYQDPSGKVQGPFSIAQLRKWSNTGYFPTGLRIWRTIEKQDDSILLTDALAGRFQKETSGDTKFLAAGTVDATHGLSGHSGKTSETSLLLSIDSSGERSDIDPNRGAQTLHLAISKGLIAPSVEVPKLSTGNWTRNEFSNLPSPTPKLSNAGETGEQGVTLIGGTSYPGVVQSPAAALPQHGSLSSVHASVLNSREQFMNGLENDSVISGTSFGQAPNSEQNVVGSVNSLPVSLLTATGEPHALEEHAHHPPAQDNGAHPIQPGNSQNSCVESHGWFAPPSQKVEPNAFVPVPGQPHPYSPWGVVSTPLAQNPAGSFSNSGASTLPQPEFLGSRAQSNQPNMQTAVLPNLAWGTGQVENNSSAPASRPENSNSGWAPMQSNPNMGWVGAAPGNTNINWGATVQGPTPGNANSGWAMTTGNLGSSMLGQMAGNVNSGWVAPPGNCGVQGLAPGNTGWVTPAGNVGSAVQVPAPGNGWALPTGNQGASQGAPSGNTNQGWGAPPGNQGTWGTEHYQTGGNFSSQRDKGSQAGDSGFGDGRPMGSQVGDSGYRRPWSRQSSFGSRAQGPDLRNVPRDVLCPYNRHGKCRKGSRCNYIHA